ncbi:EAL domain-containing protein [Aliikangiella sp. G2MR2-5]|uniref:EAL domain-containing protein n=1 Tax=Aliikangiella sp. G2MR2-5 TaxID=2788943 RepID=UPI0018ABB651
MYLEPDLDKRVISEPLQTYQQRADQKNISPQQLAFQLLTSPDFKPELYSPSLAPGADIYWYRLNLTMNAAIKLNQNSSYYLVFDNTIISHLDLYLFDQGKLVAQKSLGVADRLLADDAVYKGLYFPINYQPDSELSLLIRKQSVSPAIMPMTIYSEEGFSNYLYRQYLFWGGVLALLVVVAIYNATIFAMVKLNSYLWYLGFYLVTFFYFAGLHGYGRLLWGDDFQRLLGQNIMSLNFALLWLVLQFARSFLNAKDNAPWFERHFYWVNWSLLPGLILSLFVVEYHMIPVFGVLQTLGSLYAIVMAIAAFRNGFYPARLFLVSWVCVMLGAGIGILTFMNFIDATFVSLHGFFFGALIELILLSIALADRLRYSEKRAISNAFIDPQTLLPNFSFFRSDFFRLQQDTEANSQQVMLLIELKGFDQLLGMLGPKGAERAYRSHIERIARFLNHGDWAKTYQLPDGEKSQLIALPGDQLLVIAEIKSDYESILLPLVHLAERRIRVGKLDNQLSIQIGVARYQEGRQGLLESYRHAQLALLKAKSQQKMWAVYQKEDEDFFRERSALLADLRQAIEDETLKIYIQPQYTTHDKLLCGGEVLVRWKHPKKGMISPAKFIPLAEESNLIFKITKQVLFQSFDWLSEHPQSADFLLSINLSGIDIQHSELVPYIRWQLERTKVPAPQIIFEVTESAASQDQETFLRVISELKALGFYIAIDDFGTGYSSMSYIQQLNADFIKIDMTFVRDVDRSKVNQNIVEAIVQMADSTDAQVVAEGVETESELYKLELLGVHKIQGYLLGKPVPALAFESYSQGSSQGNTYRPNKSRSSSV